jgi:hypothetical protein
MTRILLNPSGRSRERPFIWSSRKAARSGVWTEQPEQRQQQPLSRQSKELSCRFLPVRLPIEFVALPLVLAPTTPITTTTPPPTLPAPITPAPSTTLAIPTTSTTPTSTAPPPASAPPIPPARFRKRDETEVRPLVVDPRLFDLQRAIAARVRRFRYVPVESWLPAQRDPAAADPFSTRIQESFYRAQLSAQIAL